MNFPRNPHLTRRARSRGVAMVVMLVLLALLGLTVAMNLRTLDSLGRELRLLEQQQRAHWAAKPAAPP